MIEVAYAADAAQTAGGGLMSIMPMILVLVVMYFLLFRPQQQAEKRRREMVANLKKGDRVMLSSGFYGRVVQAGEHIVKVDLGKSFIVEVNANAIAAKVDETNTETTETKSE